MQSYSSVNYEQQEKRFQSTRVNLLLVVAFSVINIFLLVSKSNMYFLFSAFVPYLFVELGMELCGMYPPEFYGADYYLLDFFPPAVFYVLLVFAALVVLVYFLCWLTSKNKKKAPLIVALVFFSIDTLLMLVFALGSNLAESMVDIAFHIWVLVSLIMGISACGKAKYYTPAPAFGVPNFGAPAAATFTPDVAQEGEQPQATPVENIPQNSPVLRKSDRHIKHRMLLSTKVLGHDVEYRRVKKTNELVIDGDVYAEYTALMELPHELVAIIDGHCIAAGYNGAHSVIALDGQIILKKLRLI